MSFPRPRRQPELNKKLEQLSVEELECIGDGNFSTVYRSGDFAIKLVNKNRIKRLQKEADVLMEKHALRRLSHPKIVRLIHTWTDADNCYIATELCQGGELWESCKRCGEPELRAKFYFAQIINALQYMHRMGIVHRDLKAENVFLSQNGQVVKIGDFGSARDLFNPQISGAGNKSIRASSAFQHYVGSANFLSPEALENKENDELSDIWSLGCLFYQVLVGIPPFAAGSEYLVYLRMQARDLMFPEFGISEIAEKLVESIVVHDRSSRPTLTDIRSHEFFTDVPSSLPALTDEEIEIKRISLSETPITDEMIQERFSTEYAKNRLRMVKTVREWELKSQPGSGTAMLDHLDLPVNSFGQADIHEHSDSDSDLSKTV